MKLIDDMTVEELLKTQQVDDQVDTEHEEKKVGV
jgi:hypothetical protein